MFCPFSNISINPTSDIFIISDIVMLDHDFVLCYNICEFKPACSATISQVSVKALEKSMPDEGNGSHCDEDHFLYTQVR